MSGTSLDGVDLALATFYRKPSGWTFELHAAETVPYRAAWHESLRTAHQLTGESLVHLHTRYGTYLGRLCTQFMTRHGAKGVQFIASHGHTVFHQPARGFTFQLGDGNAVHAVTGLPVICDFRNLDVQRGGEGAPLVPVGDRHLFSDYDVCLNLGGIANLSMEQGRARKAFDVCFVNLGLNFLAEQAGKRFDRNGEGASRGKLHTGLLRKLSSTYAAWRRGRPSLGREGFEKHIEPLLKDASIPLEDRLHTFTESIALEIIAALPQRKLRVLCTGGGAHNGYLFHRLLEYGKDRYTFSIPEREIIDFKEALIFAFLGVLRVRGEMNCLKSVTGASQDSSSGVMIGF